MDNGNINEFIKVHRNANRFELVGTLPYYRLPPAIDNPLIAQRCDQGVDIYARPGNYPCRSEGGMTFAICGYPAT